MSTELVFVGIDVAKASLEVAVHQPADRWAVDYTDSAVATLVVRLTALTPARLGPWEANPESFARALVEFERIPPSQWIDLVVGVQFSREAWNQNAEAVMRACENPIERGFALHRLIVAANPDAT